MNFTEIAKLEDEHQLATYKKMGVAAERGNGAWLWTVDGEKYLDLYGGHAVCATGHSHPHVVKAIQEQAAKLFFYSNLVYSDIRGRAAEKLVSVAPPSLTKAFFCNSGTEANENAMRMARWRPPRENYFVYRRIPRPHCGFDLRDVSRKISRDRKAECAASRRDCIRNHRERPSCRG
jgi:acetylornithine aminotransferase/acetylornithine/N-succinyldiaminopimelate aminotransferase